MELHEVSKFNSMNHTLNVRPVSRYKVKTGMGKEFRELIVKNTEKTEPPMTQMEQCSVLLNVQFCSMF